jgi:hypothetical protein
MSTFSRDHVRLNMLAELDRMEREAWDSYLDDTRRTDPELYLDVEAWAWARLHVIRRSIKRRRRALAV